MLVLGLRSWYSLSGGFMSPDEGVAAAKKAGATSVAFADLHEIGSYGEFMAACAKHEVKPIAGIELNVKYGGESRPLLLFADKPAAVGTLFQAVSESELKDGELTIDPETTSLKDLLVCTGGMNGHFYNFLFQKDEAGGRDFIASLTKAGGRVVVGLDPATATPYHLNAVLDMAGDRPIVPYRPAVFANADDQFAFTDVAALIGKNNSESSYLPSYPPMIRTMTDWVKTSAENRGFEFKPKYERQFLTMDCRGYGVESADPSTLAYKGMDKPAAMLELRTRCTAGLEAFLEATQKKINKPLIPERVAQYRSRLEEELAVGERMGIQTYLLNIADIVKMARDGKVPIGDGRGSCVNSLLCFTLDITRINPVADGLPYERFLNENRKGLPDIDIDVSQALTKRFQAKIHEAFPEAHNLRTVNYATLHRFLPLALTLKGVEKQAIEGLMGQLTEKFGTGGKLTARSYEEACAADPDFGKTLTKFTGCSAVTMQGAISLLERFGNRPVGYGAHASGIAICPVPTLLLSPVMPIKRGDEVLRAIALPFDQAEKKGAIKIDVLPLNVLDQQKGINMAIHRAGNETLKSDGTLLKPVHCSQILDRGLVGGVFQLAKQADLVRKMKIRSFNDLSYAFGLIRVMGNEEQFEANREVFKGLPKEMKAVHDRITIKTRGSIIFQEQLSTSLHEMSGLPHAQCEIIRKALSKKEDTAIFGDTSKKGPPELEQGLAEFKAGCKAKFDLAPEKAVALFGAICHGGKYMFNEGHSRSYARYAEFQIVAKAEATAETFIEMMKTARRESRGEPLRAQACQLIYESRVLGIEFAGLDLKRNLFTKLVGETETTASGRRVHRHVALGLDILPSIDNGQCRAISNAVREGQAITPALLLSSAVRTKAEDVLKLIALGAFDSVEADRNKLVATHLPEFATARGKLPTTIEAQRDYLGFLTDDLHPGLQVGNKSAIASTASSRLVDMDVKNNDRMTLTGFITEVVPPRRAGAKKTPVVTISVSCFLGDKPVRISRFFEGEPEAERFATVCRQIQQGSPFQPVLLTVIASARPGAPVYWNTHEEPVRCQTEQLLNRKEMAALISANKDEDLAAALGKRTPLPAPPIAPIAPVDAPKLPTPEPALVA